MSNVGRRSSGIIIYVFFRFFSGMQQVFIVTHLLQECCCYVVLEFNYDLLPLLWLLCVVKTYYTCLLYKQLYLV